MNGAVTISVFAWTLGLVFGNQPHVLLIVADDLGWNDVGYHGSKVVKTPTIDRLAYDGIKLENYYVQPVCTPTRSALMSGRYVTHTGLQHVIKPCHPEGLPLEDSTIADQLKSLGYKTNMVGKWHLGYYKKDYLPTRRGFDSFFGYFNGAEDYFNHTRCDGDKCGIDFHENETPTAAYTGQYSTNLFTERATEIIHDHNGSSPLFLYMAFQAVHSPLEAPQKYIDQFRDVEDPNRRTYLAMVAALDEGVSNITKALESKGIWNDTLVIFTTDNGGNIFEGANNSPLRGGKITFYEGGVRGVSFLSGPVITGGKGRVSKKLLHVSDWYPTILNLAGGDAAKVSGLDGFDQWEAITQNSSSRRTTILYDIDPKTQRFGKSMSEIFDTGIQAAIRMGDWKMITGAPQVMPGWFSEPTNGRTARLMNTIEQYVSHGKQLVEYALAQALYKSFGYELSVDNVQLFNIAEDPEERNDLSSKNPEIVDRMLYSLAKQYKTSVPVQWTDDDPQCDPKLHNGFWEPWE